MPRVIISAAHSNNDPGVSSNGVREADLTKQIAKAIVPKLRQRGLITLSSPPNMPLDKKIEWINRTGYSKDFRDIAIDIHINDGGKSGFEFWVAGNDNGESRDLANTLMDSVTNATGLPNQGVNSEFDHNYGSLAFISSTKPISIICECLYIDNPEDFNKLTNPGFIETLANGFIDGIYRYLGIAPQNNPQQAAQNNFSNNGPNNYTPQGGADSPVNTQPSDQFRQNNDQNNSQFAEQDELPPKPKRKRKRKRNRNNNTDTTFTPDNNNDSQENYGQNEQQEAPKKLETHNYEPVQNQVTPPSNPGFTPPPNNNTFSQNSQPTQNNSDFGNTNNNTFGQGAQNNQNKPFGSSTGPSTPPSPGFGNNSAPAGGFGNTSNSTFGNNSNKPSFGNTPKPPSSFGNNRPSFGNPPAAGGMGGGAQNMSREERREMIVSVYKRILGTEPKEKDVNYFVNISITEEKLVKRMLESQDFKDMRERAKEMEKIKPEFATQKTEITKLKSEIEDTKKVMNNLKSLIHQKNEHLIKLRKYIQAHIQQQHGATGAKDTPKKKRPAYKKSFKDRVFHYFSGVLA